MLKVKINGHWIEDVSEISYAGYNDTYLVFGDDVIHGKIQDIKLIKDEHIHSQCIDRAKCPYMNQDQPEEIEELDPDFDMIYYSEKILVEKLNEVIKAYNKKLKENND